MKPFAVASRELANRIALFVLCATVSFYLAIGISLDSVRRQMNAQAEVESVRDVTNELAALQDQVRQFARDYNNWSDVYQALKSGNIEFVSDNYGVTAVNGDMFDSAVIYDGSLAAPIAWGAGGTRAPQASILTRSFLAKVRDGVDNLPKGDRATFDFAIFDNGKIRMASASRILPDFPELRALADPKYSSIGIIIQTTSPKQLEGIVERAEVKALQLSELSGSSPVSVPIMGVNGIPSVHLSWTASRPGDELLFVIAPIIGVIFLVIGVFAVGGAILLRDHANALALREAEATRFARMDTLSGLPNRLALSEYLESADLQQGEDYAVILLDINNFKKVNDLLGHQGGDELIKVFSKHLLEAGKGQVFISRMGGDEFVAVVKAPTNIVELAHQTATDLMAATAHPFDCRGSHFCVTSSYGIAIKTRPSQTFEDLLREADSAMYESKLGSGNQVTLYDADLDAKRSSERQIEEALRAAIRARSEFHILYQPIVDAHTMQLHSVEALARWESPSLGPIAPDVFISVAEKSGLIAQLGHIILEKILGDMRGKPDLRVSINISPLQLLTADFLPTLRRMLVANFVSPSQIEIELTEGVAVSSCTIVGARLRQLRELGIKTALDDFGTGFSSIGYLQTMPLDTLKIDRSFVSGVGDNPELGEVLRSIVSLGSALGKSLTAEGVETMAEADFLTDAGCDHLQGYFFSRPKSLDQVLKAFPLGRQFGRELNRAGFAGGSNF